MCSVKTILQMKFSGIKPNYKVHEELSNRIKAESIFCK